METACITVVEHLENIPQSPMYRLPPEILSKIFECAKNLQDAVVRRAVDYGNATSTPTQLEAALVHTCWLFRKVASANPRLWTSINLNATSFLKNINERIIRSGACHLDIRIDVALQDPHMDDNMLNKIMGIILPLSLRWRTLCIRYTCERAGCPMIMRLRDSLAPNLEHFSITVDNVDTADATLVNSTLPHIFQGGTPKLKFIRLRGLAMQFFRPQLDYVVTLHLDQVLNLPLLYSTFRDILTRSPHLSHLSVHGDIIAPADWPGVNILIHMPRLRSLRIYSESGQMYSGILLGIEAPMLESLTFKDLQEHDLDSLWELSHDLSIRYANLKHLIFTDFDLSGPTYELIFHAFPDISGCSTISFPRHSPLMSLLLKGMAKEIEGSYTPWPRLKILAFSFDWLDHDRHDEDAIEGVAKARKGLGVPMSKFVLRVEEMEDKPWEFFDLDEDIQVEFMAGSEQAWPENEIYCDRDDTLFSDQPMSY